MAPAVPAKNNVVPNLTRGFHDPRKQTSVAPEVPAFTDVSAIPGLADLWAETRGDPAICVAVLDGPVDLAHPSLRGAQLAQIESMVPAVARRDAAGEHGTHVASMIFGQHESPVTGIAPRCRGVSIPIFASNDANTFEPCSQIDLTRAIGLAVQHGANIINISGGELSPTGIAYPHLAKVVRECARSGVLIISAAGNQGCDCLHVPAALESVLAVGGMDERGVPLWFSNWGSAYRARGILAPALGLLGAIPGGALALRSGTSYAAPIVTGVAALLLGLHRKLAAMPGKTALQSRPGTGQETRFTRAPSAVEVTGSNLVREALLGTAIDCSSQPVPDCRRLLAGRLNVRGATSFVIRSTLTMDQAASTEASSISPEQLNPGLSQAPVAETVQSVSRIPATAFPPQPTGSPRAEEAPAAETKTCGCKGKTAAKQFVYALGHLGYDLITEARCDSLVQRIAGVNSKFPHRGLAFDHANMLAYLDKNPWDAQSIEWTLTQDGTPIYAIRPAGPFAAKAYDYLREFLAEQEKGEIERVSIPAALDGKARLLNGQVVPVLVPEIRGMYSWTTGAMVKALVGEAPADGAATDGHAEYHKKRAGIHNFLERVYHEARNLGIMPQERALNFVATNAFEVGEIYAAAVKEHMELDGISVSRSPICRPESDCWDVEVSFFYPERQVQTVRKVYRFTVDVSDTVPVTVGTTRSWFAR
jgi:PatG C-terminal/Subtilase family/PatG Domain